MRLSELLDAFRSDLRPGTQRSEMIRSAGLTAALKVGSGLLAFAASLLYARALGPHDYGLYAFVMAWTILLTIPVGLGLPQYLVRQGARMPQSLLRLRRWADARTLVSGALAGVLLTCAVFIPAAAGARWLFVVAAPLPLLNTLSSLRSALLQARGEIVRSQWPRLLLVPALMVAVLTGLWFWRGSLQPIDLIIATTTTAVLPWWINGFQLQRLASGTDGGSPLHVRVRDALPFMWIGGLYLLNSRIDLIMLGSLKGAYHAGIYAIASRAAELASFLMVTANMVLAPKIAYLHHKGDHELLQRMLRSATRRIMLISVPLGLVLILGAKPLLTYLYGSRYAEGAIVLQILTIAQILIVSSGPLGTLLNMTGHERTIANNMMIAVALNATLNIILIPTYGATGAATATGISLVFSRILLWYQVRRLLGLRPTGLNY